MKKISLLGLLFLILIIFINVYRYSQSTIQAENKYSVIVSPIGYKNVLGRWQGEIAPFMGKLENAQDIKNTLPLCDEAYIGYLEKQPVITVVSGIGKVKTAICMTQVMEKYQGKIKEVILSGTAGTTPANGSRIGDLCINSVSADFDLQYYSSDQINSSEPRPVFWSGVEVNPSARVILDKNLANEIFEAAANVIWQAVPEQANYINGLYHTDKRNLKVWGPEECMEVSGDLFWHDRQADTAAIKIMNEVLPSGSILVTSMEAVSAGNVVRLWNRFYKTNIGYAYVRGVSNFDQVPVDGEGRPIKTASDSLGDGMTKDTLEYAAKTAAEPILKMFENRNK